MPAPFPYDAIIRTAYAATLALLFIYGVHRVWLLMRFRWDGRVPTSRTEGVGQAELPRVTVQLPIYNERTVASRLIRAAGALEYPRSRLEIQVLDDSTDETTAIAEEEVRRLVERGIDARVLRRPDRVGFKAGALDYGLRSAKGELICIFDADFVPDTDFLQRLVSRFDDPRVGMVQARWGHRNREDSVLTRAVATLLDGHFVIEHKVRFDAGVFFNFNGTAGVWRRTAIDTSGGWEHDTLTEDLDLSYRAQLGGWKFVYMPMVVAPAEVPPDIAAFKGQQNRWAKGSVQVFRKLGWRILTSRQPLAVKAEAMAHLTGNVGFPCVLMVACLLPLALGLGQPFAEWLIWTMFVVCTVSIIVFYETSQRVIGRGFLPRMGDAFAAIALGIGMCVSQTRAVLEGLFLSTGVFERTPKTGDAPRGKRYASVIKGLPGVELVLAAWFAWGMLEATRQAMWGAMPFLLLFFVSFAWVGWLSLRDRLRPLFARKSVEISVEAPIPQ